MRMTYIGLDPAFRKGGYGAAIITPDKVVRFPRFATFMDFIFWITDEAIPRPAVICIENSNLQNVTFNPKAGPSQHRDVGKNMAVSQCTVDLCRWALGERFVIEVSPKEKGGKWTTPETAAVMKDEKHRSTKKRLSQDDRDAYKLATIGKKLFSIREAKIA